MKKPTVSQKYGKTYHMPPEVTYDWVKKDAIEKPPVWCSVDLRDGNQALIDPMPLRISWSSSSSWWTSASRR